jgi:membrane protease YdiL (CAAX protease family)
MQTVKFKIGRWLEMIVVFIGVPLLLMFNVLPIYKIIPLLIVFSFYLFVILRDKSFKRHQFRLNGFKAWSMILWRSSIMLLFLILFTWFVFPEQYIYIPIHTPKLWCLLLLYYPLFSVIPQEFIYRVYFYHRFKGLLDNRNILILINATVFSFSHIVFGNRVVLAFTFIASILFSLTYLRYRSYTIVVVEHIIYGLIIFTIGPGAFFHSF